MKCSQYETYGTWDDYLDMPVHQRLCRCPVCKAFLPAEFSLDKPFICKKCKTELLVMPDYNTDSPEDYESGRICPISEFRIKDEVKS